MGTGNNYYMEHERNEEAGDALPPDIIENYEVKACLKKTQDKQVYLAVSKTNWKKYIIKAVSRYSGEKLEEEYRMSRSLNHPGITKAHTYIDGEDSCYLIREFIEGNTIRELVEESEEGRLSREELLRIAVQLCDILEYLHTQKPPVIHRDIKPENVIVTELGECRLIDFGISRRVHEKNEPDTVIMGTEFTAPPEQYGYSQTDARSDLYSIGILIFYMATGSVDTRKLGEYPLMDDIKSMIVKCTRFSPSQRYASAKRLKVRLLKASGYRKKNRLWYLEAAGVIILVLLGMRLVNRWWSPYSGDGRGIGSEGMLPAMAEEEEILTSPKPALQEADKAPVSVQTPEITSAAAYKQDENPASAGGQTQEEQTTFAESDPSDPSVTEIVSSQALTEELKLSQAPAQAAALTFANQASGKEGSLSEADIPANQVPSPAIVGGEAYEFKSALIEAAVRDVLGKSEREKITKQELQQISELYICGQQVYQNWNEHFVYGKSQYMVVSKYNETGLFQKIGEITGLEDIALMENLQTLALYNQKISDLTPLKELHNLQRLGLGRNNIDDLTPLLSLESLSYLDLSGNPITNADIGMLTVLPGLSGLDLGETNVNSIYSIRKLPLKYLSVFECRVGNCEGLEQMTKLETFITTGVNNMITEEAVDRIITLKNLKDLRLMGCFDFDITKLEKLTSLELLDLCGAQFDCLGRLFSSSVKVLMLSGIPELNLEGVEKFPNVTRISLSNSNCYDYTPLLRLKDLKTVSCNETQAEEIKAQLSGVPFEITN